jgi:N-carbamoyl-L-amino-acid hydrolase
MDLRRDAGLGAASLVLAVRRTVMREFPGCVANVGEIHLRPGAYNVVPGEARLRLECRSLDDPELDRLADALAAQARSAAAEWDLEVEVAPVGRWTPVATDGEVRAALRRACGAFGLSSMELPSGAGHDAQVLASVTRSGMVFVPSHHGISHDPAEHTTWTDCVNGANVLLQATVDLSRSL